MTTLNLKLEGRKIILKWGQAFFRDQILDQANFWSQAKTFGGQLLGQNWGQAILRLGQANWARPGFIV